MKKKKEIKKSLIAAIATFCLSLIAFACCFSSNLFSNNENNYTQAYIEYLNAEDKSIYGDIIPLSHEVEFSNEVESSVDQSYYCLRDEMIIYTTNQDSYGICWAHAASLSLETLYAKTFGEFIDLSESWISLATKIYHDNHDYLDYVVGGGGNITYFHNTIYEYGLVLESDFSTSDYYLVDSSNYHAAFDKYSQYAFDNLGFSLQYRNYSTIESIKNHLIQYGSLYASIDSDQIKDQKNLNSTSKTSNHAISIIGWDDEYQASDWNKPGAWIALNSWGDSWGEDGVFYISYSDHLANSVMHGYTLPATYQTKVDILHSNSNIENRICGKYNSMTSANISTFSNKNVYTQNQDIKLTYSYDQTTYPQASVTISKNNNLVQNELSKLQIDKAKGLIYLEASKLQSGTYKLEINLTTSSGLTTTVFKTFTVVDGLEIGYIKTSSTSTGSASNFDEASVYFSNFNSYNKENLNFEIYTSQYAYLYLYLPTYSYLVSTEINLSEGVTCNKTFSKFNGFSEQNNNYASGLITFNINISAYLKPEYFVSIILKGFEGQTKTINYTIKNISYSYQNLTYTYINIDYDGKPENATIPNLYALSSNRKTYLPNLTKGSATFEGYYTNPIFTEESKLPYDENGYYLLSSNARVTSGFNYTTKGSTYNKHINYIYLYAKWTNNNVVVTFVFGQQKEEQEIPYGSDAILPSTIVCEDGYEISWNKNFSNVTNDITVTGTKFLKPSIIKNLIIDDNSTNVLQTIYNPYSSHTLKVNASHVVSGVTFKYSWKYCKLDEKLPTKKLTDYTYTSSYNISKASQSGKYIVDVLAKDSDGYTSITTSQEFYIDIEKADTIIDTIGISKEYTYTGNYQTVSGARINHEESSVRYENNSFKDVGNGTKTITIISPESENYKYAEITLNVTIHPAKVTIKIDNKRGALFSEKETFTYEIKSGNVYDDLQLEFSTGASMFLAGNFPIKAVSKNSNYEVTIIDGTYSVYVEGLSLVLIISLVVLFAGACALIVYIIIKNVNMKKYIKSKKIDKDVDNL